MVWDPTVTQLLVGNVLVFLTSLSLQIFKLYSDARDRRWNKEDADKKAGILTSSATALAAITKKSADALATITKDSAMDLAIITKDSQIEVLTALYDKTGRADLHADVIKSLVRDALVKMDQNTEITLENTVATKHAAEVSEAGTKQVAALKQAMIEFRQDSLKKALELEQQERQLKLQESKERELKKGS